MTNRFYSGQIILTYIPINFTTRSVANYDGFVYCMTKMVHELFCKKHSNVLLDPKPPQDQMPQIYSKNIFPQFPAQCNSFVLNLALFLDAQNNINIDTLNNYTRNVLGPLRRGSSRIMIRIYIVGHGNPGEYFFRYNYSPTILVPQTGYQKKINLSVYSTVIRTILLGTYGIYTQNYQRACKSQSECRISVLACNAATGVSPGKYSMNVVQLNFASSAAGELNRLLSRDLLKLPYIISARLHMTTVSINIEGKYQIIDFEDTSRAYRHGEISKAEYQRILAKNTVKSDANNKIVYYVENGICKARSAQFGKPHYTGYFGLIYSLLFDLQEKLIASSIPHHFQAIINEIFRILDAIPSNGSENAVTWAEILKFLEKFITLRYSRINKISYAFTKKREATITDLINLLKKYKVMRPLPERPSPLPQIKIPEPLGPVAPPREPSNPYVRAEIDDDDWI